MLVLVSVTAAVVLALSAGSADAQTAPWTADDLTKATSLGDPSKCYYGLWTGKPCAYGSSGGVYLIDQNWYRKHYGGNFGGFGKPNYKSKGCGTIRESWGDVAGGHKSYVSSLAKNLDIGNRATFIAELACSSDKTTTTTTTTTTPDASTTSTTTTTTPACAACAPAAPCFTEGMGCNSGVMNTDGVFAQCAKSALCGICFPESTCQHTDDEVEDSCTTCTPAALCFTEGIGCNSGVMNTDGVFAQCANSALCGICFPESTCQHADDVSTTTATTDATATGKSTTTTTTTTITVNGDAGWTGCSQLNQITNEFRANPCAPEGADNQQATCVYGHHCMCSDGYVCDGSTGNGNVREECAQDDKKALIACVQVEADPTASTMTSTSASTAAAVTCGAGEYVNTDATATSTSPCLPCFASKDPRKGSYQDSVQHTETECKPYSYCGEGQYFVYGSGSTTMDGKCAACAPTTYQQAGRHRGIQCNPQARCQPYDSPRVGERYVDGGLTSRSTCVACTGEQEYQDAVQHREATCKSCSAFSSSNAYHTGCVTTTAPASLSTAPTTSASTNGSVASATSTQDSTKRTAGTSNPMLQSTAYTTRSTADKEVETDYTTATTTVQEISVTASEIRILVTQPVDVDGTAVVDDAAVAIAALNEALVQIKGFGSPAAATVDALVAIIQENPLAATDAIRDAIEAEKNVSAATILYARLEHELAIDASDATSTASADILAFLSEADAAIAQKSTESDADADADDVPGNNAGAIAGGVVAGLIALIVVAAVFIWRRGGDVVDKGNEKSATQPPVAYINPTYAENGNAIVGDTNVDYRDTSNLMARPTFVDSSRRLERANSVC